MALIIIPDITIAGRNRPVSTVYLKYEKAEETDDEAKIITDAGRTEARKKYQQMEEEEEDIKRVF